MATVAAVIVPRRISTMCRRTRTPSQALGGLQERGEERGMALELGWWCWLGWSGYRGLSTYFLDISFFFSGGLDSNACV